MLNNSRKRKAFSPLSLTYQSKLAKITTIDPNSNDGSLLSEKSCKNDLTQHKIKTFSECSPATQNYVKNTWGSGNVKENSGVYSSPNISNASKNPNNTVLEKKIKYIPDCSPMTQNMIANHRVEYLEPQEELDLLTCSTNLSSTPPKLKITNNVQLFSFSDDYNEELQHWEQEKNKENINFYFDSNIVKDSTSPFKFYSVPSSLSNNNSDRETLLLSGVTFLSISQTSNFENDQLNFEKFYLVLSLI
ncbi:uncharacterized protein [Chelonus insularis]|uniref:uncharacterized protein n=1 Tax=Chelonus insularis TaxID=460826 RepID=UPI00158EE8BB|nr:uncharacterized protein LOC118074837 [Chelonus insularis]